MLSKRLEEEVWALDRCAGCGLCVALCAKGMLFWGTEESPTLERREKALGLSHTTLDSCSFCQRFCEDGCPRLDEEWPALEPWRVVSVRTKGIVQSGEPTEVIKHLLVAALSAGLIDGILLNDMDPWQLAPITRVATSVAGIMDTVDMSLLWAPTLSTLNEAVYEKELRNLAVVGTPCVSQALRKLRGAQNGRLDPYQRALRLSIATFCPGVYRPELVKGLLANELGIDVQQIRRLEARPREDRLMALLWDGSTRAIPLSEVESYTRRGCARCDDYLGESADLAVGTLGAREGFCTLIVRSQAGEICLRNALDFGLLEISGEVDQAALRRASEEKDRRKRAQAFDNLMVMMLDGLGEPRKRVEAKQAFVRLYEVKKATVSTREEANCHVTCAEC
jgi:coenzyme F420 hydrogenase subunit beta